MSVMLANHPSPRPGFTYVADAKAREQGPVVALVSDSTGSVTALRRAAEEAAMRSARVLVVDACSSHSFRAKLQDSPDSFDERERSVALSILRNPNVMSAHVDVADFGEIVSLCQQHGASLLVVDSGCLTETPGLVAQIGPALHRGDTKCDMLIVQEQPGTVS